jgi:hypothetical protein
MAKRVFIVTNRIGRGNEELGAVLMKNSSTLSPVTLSAPAPSCS